MISSALALAFSVLFPKQNIPAWIPSLIGALFKEIVDLVNELEDLDDLDGEEKREHVVFAAGEFIDAIEDELPLELTEEQSDRIIEGLSELALFIWRNLDRDDVSNRTVRKALRRAANR